MLASIFTDGGARPTNPGPAGFGVVVNIGDRGEMLSRYLGWKTNNEAEYMGLIVGLKYAYYLGARGIEAYCDSSLVVNQVSDNWKPKDFRMKSLCNTVKDILDKMYLGAWSIHHIPREDNKIADQLCTDAIHFGRHSNPFVPQWVRDNRPSGKVIDPFGVSRAIAAQ